MVLLLVLSLLAAALGLALGTGQPRVRSVRIWGGPTEGPAPLSLRVELLDPDPIRRDIPPKDARLQLQGTGHPPSTQPLVFDAEGTAFVTFPPNQSGALVSVWIADERLATGRIQLSRETFWRNRRSRGGKLHGKLESYPEGELSITVACREGVLAMGQLGHLTVDVMRRDGQPLETELGVQLDGLEIATSASLSRLRSDSHGRVTLPVTPRDLSASLRVSVGPIEKPLATFFSSVPIETTAMSGAFAFGRLRVSSLVPLPRAYFSLINADGRWAAGAIALACAEGGQCRFEIPIDATPTAPAWLMLGTEPALDGPNVIGWPLSPPALGQAPESVTVPDQLLLDGRGEANANLVRVGALRFARIAMGIALAAILVLGTVVHQLVRSRRDENMLVEQAPAPIQLLNRRNIGILALAALSAIAIAALLAWVRQRMLGG